MKDYPLFLLPEGVPISHSRDWTAGQAKIYFDWFLSVKDDRLNYMLTAIDEELTKNDENDLKRIGQKVSDLLFELPFSTLDNDIHTITNKGLALAADMGILTSSLISLALPEVRWEILKKPKSDMSFRLPVMVGLSNSRYVEPIRYSTSYARAILERESDGDIWWKLFEGCV